MQDETMVEEAKAANTPETANVETEKKENLDVLEELERLRSTNQRLLEESRKYKERSKKSEEEKLLAEGKKDELIENLRKRNEDLRADIVSKEITEAIRKEANKRNCSRWDHLLKLTDAEGIEYDEETGRIDGVKDFFDRCEADPDYSFYFSKNERVATEVRTPAAESASIDYRKDPIGYLDKMRKENRYDEGVAVLRREGLLR